MSIDKKSKEMQIVNLVKEIQTSVYYLDGLQILRRGFIDNNIRIHDSRSNTYKTLTAEQTATFLDTCAAFYFTISEEMTNMMIDMNHVSRFVAIPYL